MIFLIVKTIFFIYLNKIQLINILIKVILLKIKDYRACKTPRLIKLHSLGKQTLTGIFPSKKNAKAFRDRGPGFVEILSYKM